MFQPFKVTSILLCSALAISSCAQETTPEVSAPSVTKAALQKRRMVRDAKRDRGTVQAGGSELIYSLAPKDTVLWLEVKSFDALTASFEGQIGEALKGLGGPSDSKSALTLLQLLGVPTNKLQLDQPMAVAFSLELGSKEPHYTLILPMADSQNTAKAIQETESEMRVEARGRFVAISNAPNYRPDITLATALQEVRGTELLGLHVETARLVDRFEVELDQALEAMRTQSSGDPGAESLRLAGATVAVETLDALSKGIKDIALRIDLVEGELTVEATANLRTGSRLTEFGMEETADLRQVLRHVNASRDEWLVGTAHKQALRFLGESLVAMYDKHAITMETKGVDTQFEQWMRMVTAERIDLALTGNLAEYKTDLALFLNGVDSDPWISLAERLVESHLVGLEDLTLMQPRKGLNEVSRFAQYDLVAQAQSPMAGELEHLLGSPRVRLRFLGHEDETMLTVGEGAHFQNRTPEKGGAHSPDLNWAFERVKGCNPAFVSRTHSEHGALDDMVRGLLLGQVPSAPAKATPAETRWITNYVAFGPTRWRMGVRMDLNELNLAVAQATALKEATATLHR